MGWPEIYEFMKARDPQFEDSLVGVPREDIAACEEGLGITLPRSYVEFLVAMGVDSGRFIPFGNSHDHDFYELVVELPPQDYPARDYFKIAIEQIEGRSPMYDLFLDLRHGGPEDAPLVMFEDGWDFKPEEVFPTGLTLLEELSSAAWEVFDGYARASNRLVIIRADGDDEIATARANALALLRRYQLEPSLPALRRVDCLGSGLGELSARLVQVPEYSRVKVTIAGNDPKQLDHLVELFIDNVPGATVDPRAPSLPGSDHDHDDGR